LGVPWAGRGNSDLACWRRQKCLLTPRLQGHPQTQRPEPPREDASVLFRKNLGGGHQRDIVSAFERHQRRTGRHNRLSGSDVPLQQPAHRMAPRQIPPNLTQNPRLRLGELESQGAKKPPHQTVVAAAWQGARMLMKPSAAPLDGQLQLDQLVQSQPPARGLGIIHLVGKMDLPHGNGPHREIPRIQARPGLLERAPVRFECAPDQTAEPALRQPLGQRIDRDDPMQVNGPIVPTLDRLGLRMINPARFE